MRTELRRKRIEDPVPQSRHGIVVPCRPPLGHGIRIQKSDSGRFGGYLGEMNVQPDVGTI